MLPKIHLNSFSLKCLALSENRGSNHHFLIFVLRLLLQRRHVCHFSLHPLGHVSLCVLVQVVFPRESLSALLACEILVTRVDDVVTGEVLVALEALHADGADERALGRVATLVLV